MHSIKITLSLCLFSLLISFYSITSNPLVLAEENTSIEKKLFFNDADPDDNDFNESTDLAPVSQEQINFFVRALALCLILASVIQILLFKNSLPIRAPPIP